MMSNSLYGNYRTRTLMDIFPDETSFLLENENNPLKVLSQDDAKVLYYLLYARYGNNSIASSDENRFIYQLFSIIYSYGPTWLKRVELQKKLRELSDEDLVIGTKQIFNQSYNPGSAPSTASLEELLTINTQNTSSTRKSKIEGYALLTALLETDVTEQFLDKFKRLFISMVAPQEPLWYEMDENVFTKEN